MKENYIIYYREIINKIEYCINDNETTNKQKLDRLKDIYDVSNNLFEIGKLNTAQFNTIFNIIAVHMWECI